ncbi:hypothetical protein D3C78_1749830 [compost metagenome]
MLVYYGLKAMYKLPFMKLIDGSYGEIVALYESFARLKQQVQRTTPNWDDLEQRTLSKFYANPLASV